MPLQNRETIYQALFTTLQNSLGSSVSLVSRRFKTFDQISEPSAVFQIQKKEHVISAGPGFPAKYELLLDIVVYCTVGEDSEIILSSQINPILDLVEAAFPRQKPFCTLGGLVDSAVIDGDIEINEGILGAQAIAIVPIKIVST